MGAVAGVPADLVPLRLDGPQEGDFRATKGAVGVLRRPHAGLHEVGRPDPEAVGEGAEVGEAPAADVRAEGATNGRCGPTPCEVAREGAQARRPQGVEVVRQGDGPRLAAPGPTRHVDPASAQPLPEAAAVRVDGRAEWTAGGIAEAGLQRGLVREPPVHVALGDGRFLEPRQPPRRRRHEVAAPRLGTGRRERPALALDLGPPQPVRLGASGTDEGADRLGVDAQVEAVVRPVEDDSEFGVPEAGPDGRQTEAAEQFFEPVPHEARRLGGHVDAAGDRGRHRGGHGCGRGG